MHPLLFALAIVGVIDNHGAQRTNLGNMSSFSVHDHLNTYYHEVLVSKCSTLSRFPIPTVACFITFMFQGSQLHYRTRSLKHNKVLTS